MVLKLRQTSVSKHLGVLRAVGIVSVRKQGKSRLYDLNPEQLQPVQVWVKKLEQHWERQLERIRARAERRAADAANPPG